jgi:transcriptional regulator with XRE-family HTH domain
MNANGWTEQEVARLREVFGKTTGKKALADLFPGRTWAGVVQKGRSLGLRRKEYWTREEEALVIQLYARAPKEEILARLPRRRWLSIERKASELRVKRDRLESYSKFTIVQELRRVRRQRDLTADGLAQKFHSYGSALNNWESGRRTPTLPVLLRWAEALNLELVLQSKGYLANTAKPIVDDPLKNRLMARDGRRAGEGRDGWPASRRESFEKARGSA